MSWNYRLFRQDGHERRGKDGLPYGGDPIYFVGECCYGPDGSPLMHSDVGYNVVAGDTAEDTRKAYKMIGRAFALPVIELYESGDFKEIEENDANNT